MLLIIELLFFIAGLRVIIYGKLPAGLFKFLFGKGEYKLPSKKARLFGVLLISALPVPYLFSFVLANVIGSSGAGLTIILEYIYIIVVAIVSISIARKIRKPEQKEIENIQLAGSSSKPKSHYGLKLLINFGIVIMSFVTIISIGSLLITIISSVTVGIAFKGNFWSDIFPFILVIAIIGVGLFCIIKLVQVLRKIA